VARYLARLDLSLLFNVADADGLDVRPLVVETLHLVSSSKAAAAKQQITLAELHELDLFLASRTHDLRKTLDDAVFLATRRALQVRTEIDSVTTIKQMVIGGLGHTVLPIATIQKELSEGLLVARPIVRPRITRHAVMASLSRRPKTRAQHIVADLIVDTTNRLIAGGIWIAKRPPKP
jgi:LysR family transcriptional regulator, nitrogen assimilation regulatory protein